MSEERAPADERVATIIDALLDEGEAVDVGAFSLDQNAATAKLEAFQYGDRRDFLLALVEGLLALGPERVELETHAADLEVIAHGVELLDPAQSLFDLYNHALGLGQRGLDYALARLAVGLDMALGTEGLERILVSVLGPSAAVDPGSASAEYRAGEAPKIVRSEASAPVPCVRILLDYRWTQVLGGGTRESLARLRAALRWSTQVVMIDDSLVSGEQRELALVRTGEGPGYRFIAGLETEGEAESGVELWSGELLIVERVPAPGIAFRAKIILDEPRRDLSQIKLVRDETVRAALEAVEGARVEIIRNFTNKADRWVLDGWPEQWPRARAEAIIADPEALPLTSGLEAEPHKRWITGLLGLVAYAIGAFAAHAAFATAHSKYEHIREQSPYQLWFMLVLAFGGGGSLAMAWSLLGGSYQHFNLRTLTLTALLFIALLASAYTLATG